MRRVISIALLATIAASTAHATHTVLDGHGDEKASFADPDTIKAIFGAFEKEGRAYLSHERSALTINDTIISDRDGDV